MRCPNCQGEVVSKENPWWPFCSERCKLLDLDNWLSGRYRVSRPFTHEDEAETIRPAEPAEPDREDRG